MLAVTYEDRVENLTGLKLLALSLQRHCPDLPLRVVCPAATPAFRAWLDARPLAALADAGGLEVRGYDVKPTLLLRALEQSDEVLWLDADVILTADPRALWRGVSAAAFVAAEEFRFSPPQGSRPRTQGWGLEVGRQIPATVNSCLMRATRQHRPLLERWARCLASAPYRRAQATSFRARPLALLNDQEVLTALLGSRDFASIPLRLLRRGREVAHLGAAAGYTAGERLANAARGLPPVVHAMARKPWTWATAPFYERLYLQLSPYLAVARAYRDELDEDTRWLDPRNPAARLLHWAALGEPSLRGMPLALAEGLARRLQRGLCGSPWHADGSARQAA